VHLVWRPAVWHRSQESTTVGLEDGMTSADAAPRVPDLPPLPLPNEKVCPFDPPPEYERLRAESPVTRVSCPTGITAWLVTRYADVRAVLGDPRRFVTRPGQAAHILASLGLDAPLREGEFPRMDGPDHLRFRRHLAPELSMLKRLELIRPLVRRVVDEHLNAFAATQPPVDVYGELARPVTTAVIAELIGVPAADRRLFQDTADALFSTGSDAADLEKVLEPLLIYVYGLVQTRRAELGDDTLSGLIRRSDSAGHPFTDIELVAMSAGLLIAGYDTTASMISYGLLALLEHTEQWARLCADPTLAATAAEELVRYLGVGTGVMRRAVVDTEIGGQRIAAGDYVVLAIQSANRDPALHADADRLDVGRRPGPHVGFGHGPHQCVGQQLARVELTEVLRALAERIPSLRLAVPVGELDFKLDNVVRGPVALPVVWDSILPTATG
jgi:cytochrome P450